MTSWCGVRRKAILETNSPSLHRSAKCSALAVEAVAKRVVSLVVDEGVAPADVAILKHSGWRSADPLIAAIHRETAALGIPRLPLYLPRASTVLTLTAKVAKLAEKQRLAAEAVAKAEAEWLAAEAAAKAAGV